MNVIKVYPIKSLFNINLSCELNKIDESEKTLHLSDLFWKNIFSVKFYIKLQNVLRTKKSIDIELFSNISELSIKCEDSISALNSINIENKKYFDHYKYISKILDLLSEHVFSPFVINIRKGFDLDFESTEFLFNLVSSEEYNPYLSFLRQIFDEKINTKDIDVILIHGRPSLFNLSQAFIIKNKNPKAHICITRHSSEYYSLNKIVDQLKQNKTLFGFVDSIILDDFVFTEKTILECLEKKNEMKNVPNLLFRDNNDNIIQTDYLVRQKKLHEEVAVSVINPISENINEICSPKEIFETVMLKNNCCFWGKCTYCGINKKYNTIINSDDFDVNEIIAHFKDIINAGYKFIIFNDEAIPFEVLKKISAEIIRNNIKIHWHVRSKIDKDLDCLTVKLLKKAGLVSIYFGLESVNIRIQNLMNKYKDPVNLEEISAFTSLLFENNIHVHYCLIIGFPGETKEEINETLSFIEKLKQKHNDLTFVVNIYIPDISSYIYINQSLFNVDMKPPLNDSDFIGNNPIYKSDIEFEKLLNIKVQFLRKTKYKNCNYLSDTDIIDLTENFIERNNFMNLIKKYFN